MSFKEFQPHVGPALYRKGNVRTKKLVSQELDFGMVCSLLSEHETFEKLMFMSRN